MKQKAFILWAAAALIVAMVGCNGNHTEEPPTPEPAPSYGHYLFDNNSIGVRSYVIAEDSHLWLKLSPLEEVVSATTYAIVGAHTEWLGRDIDVASRYHNDDYIFIYEDPVCYYAPTRPLQSGTIKLEKTPEGNLNVLVDVVLYDGTPFFYEFTSLPITH